LDFDQEARVGQYYEATCRTCGNRFTASEGGGFFFHLLRCDTCGANRAISFEEIGEPHLRYLKGLSVPYCGASSEHDQWVRENFEGEPINEEQYHQAVEEIAGGCTCGGRFRFNAPIRCPECRSEDIEQRELGLCYD
jgi:hypothetical protein